MKKLLWVGGAIILILLGAGLGLGGYGWYSLQPVQPAQTTKQAFVIRRGASLKGIAQQLQSAHLIRSALIFQTFVWQQGIEKKIQAGSYQLAPSQSLPELALSLTKGTSDVWITIKEGLRAEEMGAVMAASLPNFAATGPEFATECQKYEGYLFPNTYLLPLEFTTKQACAHLRQEYGRQVTMAMREDMHKAGHTEEQVIVMASILEREAKSLADMKMVAGILWNRIALGMPLQVDATLQYAKGYDQAKQTWWTPPTAADKQIKSPYNTYQNVGLPPGPIGNPGLNAIMAATYPTTSDYLFYVSNTDGTQLHFAKTYAEHQANIAKYLQ
jgi:UPF0755 protein